MIVLHLFGVNCLNFNAFTKSTCKLCRYYYISFLIFLVSGCNKYYNFLKIFLTLTNKKLNTYIIIENFVFEILRFVEYM